MEHIIREAVVGDAAAIGRVHMTCWREAYAHFLSPEFFAANPPERSAARWESSLGRLSAARAGGGPSSVAVEPGAVERQVWVAERAGEIVGFAMRGPAVGTPPPRALELYAIYLLESEHGSGAGQALLDHSIGDVPATLWVADQNPRAVAFYRRNGFEFDGARDVVADMENTVEFRMVR